MGGSVAPHCFLPCFYRISGDAQHGAASNTTCMFERTHDVNHSLFEARLIATPARTVLPVTEQPYSHQQQIDQVDPMTSTKDIPAFHFGGPAKYQIVVQGTVNEEWSNRLGCLTVTTSRQEKGEPRTILEGRILDQSALRGLLETLYGLHLPILEVRKIGGPPGKKAVED